MPRLPQVSGQDVVKLLVRHVGYEVRRQRGSHITLQHATRSMVTVPLHPRLDRGLLRAIIRQAGMARAEFEDLLR